MMTHKHSTELTRLDTDKSSVIETNVDAGHYIKGGGSYSTSRREMAPHGNWPEAVSGSVIDTGTKVLLSL